MTTIFRELSDHASYVYLSHMCELITCVYLSHVCVLIPYVCVLITCVCVFITYVCTYHMCIKSLFYPFHFDEISYRNILILKV